MNAQTKRRILLSVIVALMIILPTLSAFSGLRAQNDVLAANSPDRASVQTNGQILSSPPALPDNNLTEIRNPSNGELLYPKFPQPSTSDTAQAAAVPQSGECGMTRPYVDQNLWGDLNETHKIQRAEAVDCNDHLIGEAWSLWPGRDPFSDPRDSQIMTVTTKVYNTFDNSVVFERTEVMSNTPAHDGVLEYSVYWKKPSDGGLYRLEIWVTARQNVCGNGSGEAHAAASGRWPQNTPTKTPTTAPSNTPIPTNTATNTPPSTPTNTATSTPTNTQKPTDTPTATLTPLATTVPTGTLRIKKIGVVSNWMGVVGQDFPFPAGGWTFTVTLNSQVITTVKTMANGYVDVHLPPGLYDIHEEERAGWTAEIGPHLQAQVVAGQVVDAFFKNRETFIQFVTHPCYLPVIANSEATPAPITVPTVTPAPAQCPVIYYQSGNRPENTGISPGKNNDTALKLWVKNPGSYTSVVWRVLQFYNGTLSEIYSANVNCSTDGLCHGGPIVGDSQHAKPAPNSILFIVAQPKPADSNPQTNCGIIVWVDPPDGQVRAANADMLSDYEAAIKAVIESYNATVSK